MAANNNKVATIYTLSCPLTKEVRYVGKTERDLKVRYKQHLYHHKRDNSKRRKWVKSLLDIGLLPIIEPIDCVDIEEGNFYEQYWIAQFRAWGFSLVNSTDGGNSIYKATIESRLKQAAALRGRPKTKEHNLKVSIANKGKKRTQEVRDGCRERMLGKRQPKLFVPITQYTLSGEFVANYECINDATRAMKILNTSIQNCLTGRSKSAGGFKWTYQNSAAPRRKRKN